MNEKLTMLNGRIETADTLRISPLCEGFQFGAGVFTTLRLIGGKPSMLAEHYWRLSSQATTLGLELTGDVGDLRARCQTLMLEVGAFDGAMRITLFRDLVGTSELIQLRANAYRPDAYRKGMCLLSVEAEAGAALSGLKTIAYLRFLRAKRAAVAQGYDEALLVSKDGRVLEGATTNVFCVVDDALVTPPASDGLLPGVVRGAILQGRCGAPAEERRVTWEELQKAEEVFVTNSLMGVMPVVAIDKREMRGVAGPITTQVAHGWTALEQASLE